MDLDALLQPLRAAFSADLAEQVRVLEDGLVALEREAPGERRDALLRDVFRAAHGLKGSARAAALPTVEAACHAMESLLGAARDEGRPLVHDDFAALLAAVDALGEAQKRLAEAPAADVEATVFQAALAALRARLGGTTAAPEPLTPTLSPAGAGEREHGATPAAAPSPVALPSPAVGPVALPSPAVGPIATPSPPRSGGEGQGEGQAALPDGSAAPAPTRPRPRTGAVRLAPERLDALAVSSGALVTAAHQATTRAEGLDDLVREARLLRARLRAARPILARAASSTASLRARDEARAAQAALSVEDDLHRLERALSTLRGHTSAEARSLERRTRRLAAQVRALRLTAWGDATAGLERTARDVATAVGKEVDLVVAGEGLELDRSIVDALREPLGQLVRNAIDHGIEAPAERRAAGKPERGVVEVSARIEGERIFVTVRDDGRGLDATRLRDEARRRGVPAPADDRRALELVFLPGFSTAGTVTEVSGRGVGLDVVASAVRAMRGAVGVTSTPGRGTTFELALPTTLYGLRAVLAQEGDQVFAVPALDVARVLLLSAERVRTSDGRPVLLDDEPVPLAPLGHALGLAAGAWKVEDRRMALLVQAGGRRAAFAVDEVLAERELSLEPLAGALEGLPLADAVAVLPGGDLAIVLATRELVDRALGGAVHAVAQSAGAAAPPRRRVLLADDAATTRALARSILESSGYEVIVAADGEQAWALLQQHGADVLVSDVEMPRMTGFELARAVRGSPRFSKLPVVLLTALESEADRRRGLEAGADAYLVKSAFDQRVLLDTLTELVEEVP